MIEDEDAYKIVSSLLESESDSDEEYDTAKRIDELEHQIAQLQTANTRLKELALDIQKNPSRYEGRDIHEVFEEIERGEEVSVIPSSNSNESPHPLSTGILSPFQFMSYLPTELVENRPHEDKLGSNSGASADAFSVCAPSEPKKTTIQHRRRNGSFDGCASLYDYKGSIVNLSKYQPGCRFIQKQLDAARSGDEGARLVKLVLDEVMPSLEEVLTDTYGQYLIPNLVAHCSTEQRIAIIEAIKPNIFELSCSKKKDTHTQIKLILCPFFIDTYGSHGLQKMLAPLSDAEAELFGQALDRHVLALSKDPKGNYILQTYLKTFGPGPRVQFIVDRLCEHISQVSMDKVGCTVMCKCVENGSEEQRRQIVHLVAQNVCEFVQDQFANYVVQDVLNVCDGALASLVVHRLFGKVAPLCFQKFSSNVVEKCLEASTGRPEFERLYDEIVGSEAMLKKMLQDPYGNFVVQKLLDTSNAEQHERLTRVINPLIKDIKTSQYAIHIHKKLNRQQN